ncbi:MAG: PHP domain-containing protein [Candidatus Aminicenantes bacterium]|jgi:predicted metal-dependent phosphoesterase TrpH|nr:PHP domain-containing protein [Candidatus Aminicenantes bacterium]
MQGQVDLHIHSNKSSDGSLSPFHIVQLARENNLEAISITDHDTVAAYPQALQFGEEAGVEVIPGIELTTLFGSREFHLLLPFVNWKKKIIFKLVTQASKKRIKEAKERVRKLQEIGFDINWKEIAKDSKSTPPLGVTIAQVLLRKAERKKNRAFMKYFNEKNRLLAPYLFYEDYFMEGKPAWVPKQNLSLLDVLKVAPETEGVPVLAHPGAYFQKTSRKDLVILKENGLEGLEVYTSYHDPSQTEFYKKIAEELNLVPTAGSDFHGKIKPHIPFGSMKEGQYWMVEELRKRKK